MHKFKDPEDEKKKHTCDSCQKFVSKGLFIAWKKEYDKDPKPLLCERCQ